jgi:hypothetical protein
MDTFYEGLVGPQRATKPNGFESFARYYEEMDFLIYVNKDCSYRAKRVDAFLTVLLDPQKDELVGIKLKGFKFLFNQFMAVSGGDVKEGDFLPVMRVFALAMVGGVAEMMMDHLRKERAELWQRAKEFVAANDPLFVVHEMIKEAA